MREAEMKQIAGLISEALSAHQDDTVLKKVRGEVGKLCEQFPLYENRLIRSQAHSN
jgi:glycine/serine hydroxymethyltransferase